MLLRVLFNHLYPLCSYILMWTSNFWWLSLQWRISAESLSLNLNTNLCSVDIWTVAAVLRILESISLCFNWSLQLLFDVQNQWRKWRFVCDGWQLVLVVSWITFVHLCVRTGKGQRVGESSQSNIGFRLILSFVGVRLGSDTTKVLLYSMNLNLILNTQIPAVVIVPCACFLMLVMSEGAANTNITYLNLVLALSTWGCLHMRRLAQIFKQKSDSEGNETWPFLKCASPVGGFRPPGVQKCLV